MPRKWSKVSVLTQNEILLKVAHLRSRGIIYIGDSVGAHFHAPVAWFTPALLSTDVLANLSYVISNEFDWPDLGFATGFQNVSMPYIIDDFKVDSLYLRLRERNLCNHRDYQVYKIH